MSEAGAVSGSWNRNNPAIRRILGDVRELAIDPSDQYAARPCEDDMFSWHFAIRGPPGTDYEGGIYHGRIILPPDYPFKPPSILFLTPNGRWEVNKKICLSISAYHPEQWQPAWGVRTILEALISFMTTPGDGAVGALDFTPEERRRLARESQNYSHPMMPEIPEPSPDATSGNNNNKYKDEIAKMHIVSLEPSQTNPEQGASRATQEKPSPSMTTATNSTQENSHSMTQERTEQVTHPAPAPNTSAEPELRHRGGSNPRSSQDQQREQPVAMAGTGQQASAPTRRTRGRTDWLLYYAVILALIIFAILYRKALRKFRGA